MIKYLSAEWSSQGSALTVRTSTNSYKRNVAAHKATRSNRLLSGHIESVLTAIRSIPNDICSEYFCHTFGCFSVSTKKAEYD
jgi:hypothetical protein